MQAARDTATLHIDSSSSSSSVPAPTRYVGLYGLKAAHEQLAQLAGCSAQAAEAYQLGLLQNAAAASAGACAALRAHANGAASMSAAAALSRAVFEPEENNIHVEPAVSAQYSAQRLPAALQMRSVSSSSSGGDEATHLAAAVLAACNAALETAAQVAQLLPDACRHSEWIGGCSSHPTTFLGRCHYMHYYRHSSRAAKV